MDYCSHRPVEVHNVYNQVQVKMLMKEVDCDNIPAFDDVFRDDEDETFQV
jgi:cell division control protein 45